MGACPELPREIQGKIFHLVAANKAAQKIQRHWRDIASKYAKVVRGLERMMMNLAKKPVDRFTADMFVYRDRRSQAYLNDGLGIDDMLMPPHVLILAEMMAEIDFFDRMADHLPVFNQDDDPLFIGTMHCEEKVVTIVLFQRVRGRWRQRVGRTFSRRWRSDHCITLRERKRLRYCR